MRNEIDTDLDGAILPLGVAPMAWAEESLAFYALL